MNSALLTPRESRRPLSWIDPVLDLQELLLDHGQPIYIVGGAVRDAYLSRPIKDIDLTTPSGAIKLARRIADALHGDVFVMDAERDVARVLIESQYGLLNIDVAAFRGDDLLADLYDRDFTINAMAVDLRGNLALLIDPLNGETDLVAKVLRRCADNVITADPIRALRAVRQSVQLGLRMEPGTVASVRQNAPRLAEVSNERLRDELFKLLSLVRPSVALRVAHALGLLDAVLPQLTQLDTLTLPGHENPWDYTLIAVEKLSTMQMIISPERNDNLVNAFDTGMLVVGLDRFRARLQAHIRAEYADHRSERALLILMALLHGLIETHADGPADTMAADVSESLRLSNPERARLTAVWSAYRHPLLSPGGPALTPLALHRYWYPVGDAGVSAVLLNLAHQLAAAGRHLDQNAWLHSIERAQAVLTAYFEQYDSVVSPPPLVKGGALMAALDLAPGPLIGELLTRIREAQVSETLHSQADALDLARRYIDERRA